MRSSPTWAAGLCLALAACSTSARPPADPRCAGPPAQAPGLRVAGTGSALPLARTFAARWERRGHPAVVVADSIGSGGAVQALADGVIDLGLTSRALSPAERALVGEVVPFARSPLGLVAHARGAPRKLRAAEVVDLFAGRTHTWPDGTPVVPLLREAGDSGYPLLAAAWPALHQAMRRALDEERLTVTYTDQEMRDTLAATEGAIGLLDAGIVRFAEWQAGSAPELAALTGAELQLVEIEAPDGAWPLAKPLAFVLPKRPSEAARAFVAFATSPEIADLRAAGGYLEAAE